jgi:hypothetical protein
LNQLDSVGPYNVASAGHSLRGAVVNINAVYTVTIETIWTAIAGEAILGCTSVMARHVLEARTVFTCVCVVRAVHAPEATSTGAGVRIATVRISVRISLRAKATV